MQPLFSLETIKLKRVHWMAPLGMAAIVVFYEFVLSTWVLGKIGLMQHILMDTIFYGVTGPLLVFYLLKFILHWLEERETSELQARILDQSRLQVNKFRDSADTALQNLFASSILIQSLSSKLEGLTPQEAEQLEKAQKAIDVAIRDLRRQLESSIPAPKVAYPVQPVKNGELVQG